MTLQWQIWIISHQSINQSINQSAIDRSISVVMISHNRLPVASILPSQITELLITF